MMEKRGHFAGTLNRGRGGMRPFGDTADPCGSMHPLVRTKEVGAMRRIIAILAIAVVLLIPAVAQAGSGGTGNDRLYGTVDADLLSGGPGQDIIFGRAGDDVIHSGAGADSIWGGRGFDVCYVSASDIASGCEVTL